MSFVYNIGLDTVDTTRVNTGNPFVLAVWNSQLIYPSSDVPWRPRAAIIASNISYHYAMSGASIIHHPSASTHLLTAPNLLPQITARELLRLQPRGEGMPAQVFVIGPVGEGVLNSLRWLGFSYIQVGSSPNPYQAAVDIANFRLDVIPPEGKTGKVNVIITSGEDFSEALPAPAFAAHMGTPILFVKRNALTGPTEAFIRSHRDKNYFILGSSRTISQKVEEQINEISEGIVHRIPGNNPFEIAVQFAMYHKAEAADFGWNRQEKGMGDAFNFAPVHHWENAVMSALQGHEGKHTPELTITYNMLPDEVKEYLEYLRPVKAMPMPPFMHGFIQGDLYDITYPIQVEIEKSIIFREGHNI